MSSKHGVAGSSPAGSARIIMIYYILAVYVLTVLAFFGWTIKDVEQVSTKLAFNIFMLSFAWPIVLIVYYLDGKEPN